MSMKILVQIKPDAPQGAALYDRRGRILISWASIDTSFKLDTALNLDCD